MARGLLQNLRQAGFALVLLIILLVINIYLNPARFSPLAWGALIGLAAPLIAAAMASTPVILGGGGGIDISIGPQMGFINGLVVVYIMGHSGLDNPLVVVISAALIGGAVGMMNGLLAAYVRMQPIVTTLGTYLVLLGLTVTLVPAPTGTIPEWLRQFSGSMSLVPLLAIMAIWGGLKLTPYYGQLMATGSDDRACYSAGINVARVRLMAYVLSGVFAGFAALSLTALIGSADAGVGGNYTLLAISAVALGGVSLAGGKGGMTSAVIGALDIFLLQSALTYFNVSTFVLQVAYGLVLVLAISFAAIQERVLSARRQP